MAAKQIPDVTMNLLYTLTTYPPSTGGAQIHQHQLAQQLKERHNIQVVAHWDRNRTDWLIGTTVRAPSREKDYTIDGIEVHCIGYSGWERFMIAPFAAAYYPMMMMGNPPLPPIAALIEKHVQPFVANVDLIHNVRIGREGMSYASFNLARKRGIPFVLTPVHHPRWEGRKYKAYNTLYTRAEAVMALTNAEKEVLVRLGVKEERVHVIGHGPVLDAAADPGLFMEENRIESPMVLFLGQHYPYKGYKELLEAAKMVWEKKPGTHFVFIGPAVGQSEAIFGAMADPRIHRMGTVSPREKASALAACTMLCVPSMQESFGGVYAEAWSYEKPVIGCDIPAVAEVIGNGQDGFLVRQESADIAEKIILLLENESAARRMGAAGKKKVEEKYTWLRIAERVEKVYNNLL